MSTYNIYHNSATGREHVGTCNARAITAMQETYQNLEFEPVGLSEVEQTTSNNLKTGLAIMLVMCIVCLFIEKL